MAGSSRNSEPATLGSAYTLSIDTKESSIPKPAAILQASWKHDDLADAGYSIVEVLLAITILAVVLLAAARGVMGERYAASVAKEHSVATRLNVRRHGRGGGAPVLGSRKRAQSHCGQLGDSVQHYDLRLDELLSHASDERLRAQPGWLGSANLNFDDPGVQHEHL